MNIIDEYYFFLQKGITNTDLNRKYYFDKKTNILFCTSKKEGILTPYFRNKYVEVDINNFNTVEEIINSKREVIELPKLTFLEKREFLIDFINLEKDAVLLKQLNNEYNVFNENSDFLNVFIECIQKIDKKKAYDFHILLGQFLKIKINKTIELLGIGEDTVVIW